MNAVLANWKTSILGVLVAVGTIAAAMQKGSLDPQTVSSAVAGLLTSLGLLAAKDAV